MLENLSTRLQGIFSGLRGKGRLTEDDINDACARSAWRFWKRTSTSRW